MTIDVSLLNRFVELFKGYDKAYGQYVVKKAAPGEKASGKAWTVGGTPGEKEWREHLDGTGSGMGVIMLQEDNTCRFGAIDVDDRATDHVKLEAKVRKMGLPLVVCRSKSGGAHLYCFTSEDVDSAVLQKKLAEWCALLGYSDKTEIFPKQTSRFNDQDKGNWINLPYYNFSNTLRYCLIDGKPVDLERFLEYAESMKVTADSLQQTEYAAGAEDDDLYEAPPCLQHFEKLGGFAQGGMKNGMFNVGVYLRKRFPDEWETKFEDYNHKLCSPPLRMDEMRTLIKSLSKKDYCYTCKQHPINSVCQKRLCLGRKFGVGDGGPGTHGLDIRIHTKYVSGDSAIWSVEVNGQPLMINTEDLYSSDAFNKACMTHLSLIPVHVPPARWKKMVGELISQAEVVYEPEEASEEGQLWIHIKDFLLSDLSAKTLDEIDTGRPHRENGTIYFESSALFTTLKRNKVNIPSEHKVYRLLKAKGGSSSQKKVKGKNRNLWSIPDPDGNREVEMPPIPDFSDEPPVEEF